VKLTGLGTESVTETLTIHVTGEATGIEDMTTAQTEQVYDLQGRQRGQVRHGVNIIRRGGKVMKAIMK
jgi:hypothetical protein